jgi:hypothetical protein
MRSAISYYGQCGDCNAVDLTLAAPTRKQARTKAIQAGWRFLRTEGFKCPICYAAYLGAKKLVRKPYTRKPKEATSLTT